MKIIELLNKIANGEEVPKKIKVLCDIYYYCGEDISGNCYYSEPKGCGGIRLSFNTSQLNDEVEILEEEKKIPENNFNYIYLCEDEHIMTNFENIQTTLKDIIDYLKSKGE